MLWRSCLLRLGVVGMNFKTSDLKSLEKMARGAMSLLGERSLFFKHPTIVLSTCNRTEIYFSADDLADAQGDILSFLRTQIEDVFEHKLYSYFGLDALTHLCRVTSGLDSAILAETEIQGQVKTAYIQSTRFLDLPECLHYSFQKSLKVAKEFRGRFFLERKSATLYGTLWQMGTELLGDLRKKSILLVGYSEINRGFSSFLMYKGVDCFSLCTTDPEKVCLDRVNICGRDALKRWHEYDLIVCATRGDDYLIEGCGQGGVIFDLSMPRNVDPQVKEVTLMNIQQIHEWIRKKEASQGIRVSDSEIFIEEKALQLAQLYRLKIERKEKSQLQKVY